MVDLRLPTGLLFTLFGVILLLAGVFKPGMEAPLASVNVNLYCGLVMLVFGGVMLWLSRRHS